MAEMWFYTSEGKQMDAVSIQELKRMVSDGVLKPTDMVWKDGMPRWVRASSVNELYPNPTAGLDQYFTTGKDNQPVGTGVPAAAGAVTAPTVKNAPAAPDEESRSRGNKRHTSGADEHDLRPASKKSGGSSVGIIVAVILGGGLLLVALVVGVIILVVATQRGPNPPRDARAGGERAQPKAPPASFTKVVTEFTMAVPANSTASRNVPLKRGIEYQVSVRTVPNPDIDLFIFNNRTGKQEAHDDEPDENPQAYFTAPDEGEYRIELHNLDERIAARSTVTIREPEIKKEDSKDPPLKPGEKTVSGVASSISLAAGEDTVFLVRVKAGVQANFMVTTHLPKARPEFNHLFILKENNDTALASDTQPAGKAQASFVPTVTETVRVRVVNTSKTTTRVSITYNLGP